MDMETEAPIDELEAFDAIEDEELLGDAGSLTKNPALC
jgi:hypothetical protein